jgi:hypothetical protein
MKNWPRKQDNSCFAFAALNFLIAYASWISLGFVAFSRYLTILMFFKYKFLLRFLGVNHPKLCKALSVKHRNLMMVGGIWLYALSMLFLPLMGGFGHFGYSDRL